MKNQTKSKLLSLFNIAVNESLPAVCMPKYLANIDAKKGLCVLGAGKASVEMAKAVYQQFGDKCFGAIVTRHGYTDVSHIGAIKILKAGHPIPDINSLIAGEEILALARNNPQDIPVIFLISGGASALLSLPIEGLSFDDKIKINQFLLRSGASIDEINVVRKQLSRIKGNKLAMAVKGEHHTFIISDVVGDDPSLIASGPTVRDSSTAQQAIAILARYKWSDMPMIEKILGDPAPVSSHNDVGTQQNFVIMANAKLSIDKAVEAAKTEGWETKVLTYDQQGEASVIAKQHAQIALEALNNGETIMLFSGGELTVTLSENAGLGGPNQEYVLALAIALNGVEGISALACDTDGVDGNKDVAGAYMDSSTLWRARELNLNPVDYLKRNDSYNFFNQLDDLIVTGPTHTNVNDFRAIVVQPKN